MSHVPLRPGSLVLYKIHPALVRQVAEKIEIELGGGKTRRVRGKDITVLHPGPLQQLGGLEPPVGDVAEAWALLEGEQTALPELAELVFGEYSPASAWATWKLLDEGLYFEGQPGAITGRSRERVEADQAARVAREQAAAEWDAFIARVRAAEIGDADRVRLAEVERVALGKSEKSRILEAFKVKATPTAAHDFLLRCGYWPPHFNPWPERVGVTLQVVDSGVPDLLQEDRLDLTHLTAWAIDDAGNTDPDDAISIENDRLWVHIADVGALVRPGGHLDQAARARSANLYLPEQTWTMLPATVTELLGMGLAEHSPALSVGFTWDGEKPCAIQLVLSRVKVTRTSYEAADGLLDSGDLARVKAITDAYRARRCARDAARIDLPEVAVRIHDGDVVIKPLPALVSRELVTDAMLMAGEAVARYADEQGIPIPYAVQPPPDEVRQPATLSDMYGYRRLFKPSRISLEPQPHFGLGLPCYARATSPLRRYPDLLVHQQIRAHLLGRPLLDSAVLAERVAGLDVQSGRIRRAERLSNLHWKLVYLGRRPKWRGAATVVALEERRATVIIPELGMEARLRRREDMALDQVLQLTLREVDLPAQTAGFSVLEA